LAAAVWRLASPPSYSATDWRWCSASRWTADAARSLSEDLCSVRNEVIAAAGVRPLLAARRRASALCSAKLPDVMLRFSLRFA
jgi:hypothetical protein